MTRTDSSVFKVRVASLRRLVPADLGGTHDEWRPARPARFDARLLRMPHHDTSQVATLALKRVLVPDDRGCCKVAVDMRALK